MKIEAMLARELGLTQAQVRGAVELLDAGKTVPFIARYRKEQTGSMDDQTLRALEARLGALRGLEKRSGEIRAALEAQGALTTELAARLNGAVSLAALEDIYRPYRPKRRTRASVARERGLEPLAARLLLQRRNVEPERAAAEYLSAEVPDVQAALAGARDILAEQIANDAALRGALRERNRRTATLESRAAKEGDNVYRMYDGFSGPLWNLPAHRILAINRGEREGWLKVSLHLNAQEAQLEICHRFVQGDGACAQQVRLAALDAWQRLIAPALERELRGELTERAEEAGIREFSRNLRQLLMQPPVKGRVTLGVDPGYRTGCKLAVVDAGGKVLDTGVAYFTLPAHEKQRDRARETLRRMIAAHGVTAVAIGNGTASRESEAFIAELLREMPERVEYAVVNEAGASVYSASELGAKELPELDVTLRGAVAIARRLQDPLAELVKIDPKSIGVGQYQHDLKDAQLSAALDGVVESCVSAVGVELSTASAALLEHVAGIGPQLAKNIVDYREANGFTSRAELKKVPKLGARAFEQCAGFLRLRDGAQPLDATGVHPESYAAARIVMEKLGCDGKMLRGGAPEELFRRAADYGEEQLAEAAGVGLPTLRDILRELVQPGRDPREDLPPVLLRSDVLDVKDLKIGMELQGTVRNVIDFGAFVDVGVHQDGLVHISRMARRFIRHPSEVVKLGDVVTVWVLDVDAARGRIALTMLPPEDAQG